MLEDHCLPVCVDPHGGGEAQILRQPSVLEAFREFPQGVRAGLVGQDFAEAQSPIEGGEFLGVLHERITINLLYCVHITLPRSNLVNHDVGEWLLLPEPWHPSHGNGEGAIAAIQGNLQLNPRGSEA